MKIKGWELDFFNTGEWQVCDERLRDLSKASASGKSGFNPRRSDLFRALSLTPFDEVKVAIIGQDPYPSPAFATGVAFSIPADVHRSDWPPTLKTFLGEYSKDLGYPCPSSGDLEEWCSRGVLLWNAIPSCRTGQSLSHDWPDDSWGYLTREIITRLTKKGIVFALLGQVARRHSGLISLANNHCILTSHPSPRGSLNSHTPFIGRRLFSTINAHLVDLALEPVNWRLE